MIISLTQPPINEQQSNEEYIVVPATLSSLKFHLLNKTQAFKPEKKKRKYYKLKRVCKNKRKIVFLTLK